MCALLRSEMLKADIAHRECPDGVREAFSAYEWYLWRVLGRI